MTKDELIQFLLETEIPDNLEKNKEIEIVSKIFKSCWNITPSSLYRYRVCNQRNFETLEADQFLLTKPTLFNDPYDSLLFIDKQKILNTITKKSDFNLIEKLKNDSTFRRQQEQRLGKEFIDKILSNNTNYNEEKIGHYKSISDKFHSNLVQKLIDQSIQAMKQSSLVACLSENYESILMWSHYADNHRGFVLNYDFKSRYSIETKISGVKATEFADKKLFPVSYTDTRYDATYYVEFHFIEHFFKQMGIEFKQPFYDKLFYYKILLFKSNEWSYEREWRIIKQTNVDYYDGKPDISFIKNIVPKEIIMGANMSPQNKDRLIKIAEQKGISVSQMRLEPFVKEYKLTKVLL